MKRFLIFALVVLSACALFAAEEREKQVAESQVPQAVLKAFTESYPGTTVKEYAEEKEDNNTFYEISCKFQERHIDVLYKVDGSVSEIEEGISEDTLPAAVKATINKKFKDAIINLAEKKLQDGKTFYEVKLTTGDDKYEVLFTDAGKLIEKAEIQEDEE